MVRFLWLTMMVHFLVFGEKNSAKASFSGEQIKSGLPVWSKETVAGSIPKEEETVLFGGKPAANQCQKDLVYVWRNRFEPWAKSLIDATGKPEVSWTRGNNAWLGDYDSCLEVSAPRGSLSPEGFRGKFVYSLWSTKNETNNQNDILVGTCVPSSCTSDDIWESYPRLLKTIDEDYPGIRAIMKNLDVSHVVSMNPTQHVPISGKLCLLLFGVFFFLAVTATILNSSRCHPKTDQSLPNSNGNYSNEKYHEKSVFPRQFLSCFSMKENFDSLMDTTMNPVQINCVHGIRVITMVWVVFDHAFGLVLPIVLDPVTIVRDMDNMVFQVIIEGHFAVDTFFLMSGLLHSYLLLKSKIVLSGFQWTTLFFHRYLRISPPFFMILFFGATVLPYLGDGPQWMLIKLTTDTCQYTWWSHLLYISNLVSSGRQCLGWSWFLPNDMQLFILGTVLLFFIKKYPRKIMMILCSTAAVFIVITVAIVYVGNFNRTMVYVRQVGINTIQGQNGLNAASSTVYTKFYCRTGPYIVGILYGYYLSMHSNRRIVIPKFRLMLYWFLACTGVVLCLFGMQSVTPTPVLNSIYFGIGRHVWGASVGWVIYACATGNAGLLNSILSWKVFLPLSRLSYSVYLIHPLLFYILYFNLRQKFRYNFMLMFYITLGITASALVLAVIFDLLVQCPLSRLEKLLHKKKERK